MKLAINKRGSLLIALEALFYDDSRRFEDRLWLGFGDHWLLVRSGLVRDGVISINKNETSIRLTSRGRRLVEKLQRDVPDTAR